ncbi:MAG: response regulator [Anaerocolumna sp.]
MVKVLIVEDDNFARKGLINAMPWEKHSMEVVGDVTNGKAALEFLEKESVDLILSDYSMPVMNGLDLLKSVQEKYPETLFAMITLYETFDIIQQALRFGAIDYISKLQLEEENYDQVLSNLNELIIKNRNKKVITENSVPYCGADSCYVFSCINNQEIHYLTKRFAPFFLTEPKEIGNGLYVYFLDGEQMKKEEDNNQYILNHVRLPWIVTNITGLTFYEQDKFFHNMRKYYRYHLFYHNDSSKLTISQLENIVSHIADITEEELEKLVSKWLGFDWIYNRNQFNGMLTELKNKKLSFTILFKLLVHIEDVWVQNYSMVFADTIIKLPTNFYCFEEVQEWLTHVFEAMNRFITTSTFSPEVIESITKAIFIIQNEIADPIFATDVSERVNMSRSYFCQCFKKITGMSFNQFLRSKRVELAKYYLENTDLPIQLISDKTGYMDEKYFGKVFKLETGLLPSKYRKLKQNSSSKVI